MSNFDDFLKNKQNETKQPTSLPPQPNFNPYTPPASQIIGNQYSGTPATFDRRFGALIIDTIVVNIGAFIAAYIIFTIFNNASEDLATIIGIATGWLYYAYMESSEKQATLGKLACGLVVTNMQGQRISFGQASGRHFSKIVSAIILCIGFLMCIWTQKKQCLHDIMAGCLVLRK